MPCCAGYATLFNCIIMFQGGFRGWFLKKYGDIHMFEARFEHRLSKIKFEGVPGGLGGFKLIWMFIKYSDMHMSEAHVGQILSKLGHLWGFMVVSGHWFLLFFSDKTNSFNYSDNNMSAGLVCIIINLT